MRLRKIFASRLQTLMEERLNLDTQAKVSKAANISQSSVGRFLKGTVAPTLDNIESLADTFQVPVSSLIHDQREGSNIHGIDYRIQDLASQDRRKILEYVELVCSASSKSNPPKSFTQTIELTEAQTAAVKRSAGRAMPKKGN